MPTYIALGLFRLACFVPSGYKINIQLCYSSRLDLIKSSCPAFFEFAQVGGLLMPEAVAFLLPQEGSIQGPSDHNAQAKSAWGAKLSRAPKARKRPPRSLVVGAFTRIMEHPDINIAHLG